MKKFLIIVILALLLIVNSGSVNASKHYTNFEDIKLTKGKLINDYEDKDLSKYYKKVDKKKFSGWRIEEINKRVKVTFVGETLFSYYNDGYTSMDYTYKMDTREVSKYNFSATGSIGVKTSGTKSGFKSGLDGSIKLSYTNEKQIEKKESYEIKVKVDPGTQVNLYTYGEGKITNGVAAKYFFWFRVNRGGYEVFELTTEYQRLEKVRIWKSTY